MEFATAKGIDAVELSNAPTITLGGVAYHVPRLAIAQNRIVVGCLKKLMPLIGRFEAISQRAKADPATAAASIMDSFPIDDDTFDIIARAVYAALTRGYVITQEQFDNMPAGADELVMAIPVVLAQSFAFVKKREGTPPAPQGEAPPKPTTSPTPAPGTESP